MDLFTTYIRPKLKYCTPVWCPNLKKDVDRIQDIQRRYTRLVFRKCSVAYSSYEDRLQKIDFMTLKQRREFYDLVSVLSDMSD